MLTDASELQWGCFLIQTLPEDFASGMAVADVCHVLLAFGSDHVEVAQLRWFRVDTEASGRRG